MELSEIRQLDELVLRIEALTQRVAELETKVMELSPVSKETREYVEKVQE